MELATGFYVLISYLNNLRGYSVLHMRASYSYVFWCVWSIF